METIYFLSLVAFCLAVGLLALRKVNARSYIHGERNDAVELEQARSARLREKAEKPRFAEYVDWYTSKFEHGSTGQEDFQVGRAYVVNETINNAGGQRKQAMS